MAVASLGRRMFILRIINEINSTSHESQTQCTSQGKLAATLMAVVSLVWVVVHGLPSSMAMRVLTPEV
jgi:hypothetical protein